MEKEVEEVIKKYIDGKIEEQNKKINDLAQNIKELAETLAKFAEAEKQKVEPQPVAPAHEIEKVLSCPECKKKLEKFIDERLKAAIPEKKEETIKKKVGGTIFVFKKKHE